MPASGRKSVALSLYQAVGTPAVVRDHSRRLAWCVDLVDATVAQRDEGDAAILKMQRTFGVPDVGDPSRSRHGRRQGTGQGARPVPREPGAKVVVNDLGGDLTGEGTDVTSASYVVAKAGIAALTVGLASELAGYDIRVNAIAPVARTRMTMASERLKDDFARPSQGARL